MIKIKLNIFPSLPKNLNQKEEKFHFTDIPFQTHNVTHTGKGTWEMEVGEHQAAQFLIEKFEEAVAQYIDHDVSVKASVETTLVDEHQLSPAKPTQKGPKLNPLDDNFENRVAQMEVGDTFRIDERGGVGQYPVDKARAKAVKAGCLIRARRPKASMSKELLFEVIQVL